jgi:diaminopimelate decarboxylase
MDLAQYPLEVIAAKVGTPFYFYDAAILKRSLSDIERLTTGKGLQARYAMKANSSHKVLAEVLESGLWIDAVSGNEALRALRSGFAAGCEPPVVMYTADVFRDNAIVAVCGNGLLPNVGSPGMIRELAEAGYRGPIALRINPGFGHGHVASCDTGGPSSKHGLWFEDIESVAGLARSAGLPVVGLHAHIGTGPQPGEFDSNMRRLTGIFADLMGLFPDVRAVNFGGGIPHPYRPGAAPADLGSFREVLITAEAELASLAGRSIRVEIEPGRYAVAGMAILVTRVKDIKATRQNEKGDGHEFVMVDAGFNDLIRPAMYGSYHHISIIGQGASRAPEPFVVAGPLCESGDVFTRDDNEMLDPRMLGRPAPGDLLVLHDAGAYGAAMSSNYVSMGRAAQVYWENGRASLIARRETLEDVVRNECDEAL